MPFADESADVVLCNLVLHFARDEKHFLAMFLHSSVKKWLGGHDTSHFAECHANPWKTHYRAAPSPAARNACSCEPAPEQQSASLPSITTAGTVCTPYCLAFDAMVASCISWTLTSHDPQASRWTRAIVSSHRPQPAVKTSTFLLGVVISLSPCGCALQVVRSGVLNILAAGAHSQRGAIGQLFQTEARTSIPSPA